MRIIAFDPAKPHTEAQLYEWQLQQRVQRLAKLVELKAPKYIIASEVILVMKAASGFCGEAFGEAWQKFMLTSQRMGMGLCVNCGAGGVEDAFGLCPKCVKDAQREDESEVGDDDPRHD